MKAYDRCWRAVAPPKDTIIFGFDSAWADQTRGAICALSFDACGRASFKSPVPASFEEGLEFIKTGSDFARVVVALDQPTIVPNATGMRPAERVAASLLGYTGGGVQPANRCSRADMFGDGAPIWKFKKALAADDDPQRARSRLSGRFLVEVFPALASPGLHAPFACRLGAPKYNPKSKKFHLAHWEAVVKATGASAKDLGLSDVVKWCSAVSTNAIPAKSEQDCLDSVICALVGFIWLACSPSATMMLGDLKSGYIATPVSDRTRTRLVNAAVRKGVPIE